ncbi:tRNA (adenosine(37)-N6)-threonylcarbamoyltransferase complex ATPase subunit type 1 TsaE [Rhabdochlamydiaceae symbiont of Dictyostelium giganteum]|uniref:tRNA (adenosine(37)-N6)-threonylcarbamoyltransferase complex ATPase subunit type 1 TsaE n=1 Tax=Rhabdochlamydiaceae symbiont of Dictyostelium giganteum TaxID=3342349 RepID=UPI00384F9C97
MTLMKELLKQISSPQEMEQFGRELAILLQKPNLILGLKGDLGAGKTTFLKGFISELTGEPARHIQSPTFTYLQVYQGLHYDLYHFDLYRIQHAEQFVSAGFLDYTVAGGICCFEWTERVESILPKSTLFLDIHYQGASARECRLYTKEPL